MSIAIFFYDSLHTVFAAADGGFMTHASYYLRTHSRCEPDGHCFLTFPKVPPPHPPTFFSAYIPHAVRVILFWPC